MKVRTFAVAAVVVGALWSGGAVEASGQAEDEYRRSDGKVVHVDEIWRQGYGKWEPIEKKLWGYRIIDDEGKRFRMTRRCLSEMVGGTSHIICPNGSVITS